MDLWKKSNIRKLGGVQMSEGQEAKRSEETKKAEDNVIFVGRKD